MGVEEMVSEEVVSEEVVTDEPVVLIDGVTSAMTNTTLTVTSSMPSSASLSTTSSANLLGDTACLPSSSSSPLVVTSDSNIVLTPSTVTQLLVQSLSVNQPSFVTAPTAENNVFAQSSTSTAPVIETTPISLSMGGVATEEVVISEPLIEAFVTEDADNSTITLNENQVMMLMENGTIVPSSSSSSCATNGQADSVITVSSIPSSTSEPQQ